MAKPKKVKSIVKPLEVIKARIKVLGHFYEAAGQTVAEAITNLKPLKGRGMSILEVTKGDKQRNKILNFRTTMLLFSPSTTQRNMALKNVISMFSDL